jgi:pyruvate kinase
MSTSQDRQALLDSIRDVRSRVLAAAEDLLEVIQPQVERASFAESARNLACYLALRRHDLRGLQVALMRWGLSSLGRSESRVQSTLDAVLHTLGVLCGAGPATLPPYPSEEAIFSGSRILAQQAEALFGTTEPDRPTRIMVTLATEAAEDPALIEGLLKAGMDCVRINCAHDDENVWQRMLGNLRAAERALGLAQPVRVLMDLSGPKLRTVRPKKQEKDRYEVGDQLLLTGLDVEEVRRRKPRRSDTRKKVLPVVGCSLPAPLEHLSIGDSVYIDDGQIGARVTSRVTLGVVIEIVQAPLKGRKIRSEKGINFPDTEFELSSLTDKDRRDLSFVAQHADMIGYSFVQTEDDVAALLDELAQRVQSHRTPPALVLKIETKKAVQNLPALIVRAAGKLPTGVMIARGDLAIELGFDRIAEMQEEILWLCEAAHVPVIWATQVLEGLAKDGLPTRAEVTDAAMAARAECVMLNKGPRIIDAVKMLATLLGRMHGHQYKKTPQLRVLHAWESAFQPAATTPLAPEDKTEEARKPREAQQTTAN